MKMDDMEHKVHGAKKSSLMALHKMMKDLHHKSMGKMPEDDKEEDGKSPHAAMLEVDIEHSPINESEHDEENKGLGVDPFDDSQMEGDQAAELADHPHDVEESEMDPMDHSHFEAHEPEAHMEPSHLSSGVEEMHEEDENKGMNIPKGIHEMLMDHLKKKK